MKVIFLDIDGVLNSSKFLSADDAFGKPLTSDHIDPEAVKKLNEIIASSGAEVVITSSWRIILRTADIRGFLNERGFEGVVRGVTPHLGKTRGLDIQKWLDENPPVEKFVILDDDGDMNHLMPHLIKTSWESGLQDEHVKAAIEYLLFPLIIKDEEITSRTKWPQHPVWENCIDDFEHAVVESLECNLFVKTVCDETIAVNLCKNKKGKCPRCVDLVDQRGD